MKDLVKGFVKWLIIVLATLTIITWGTIIAHCQNKIVAPPYYSHEEHKDLEDMEEDIRLKSIFIVATDPRMVFWKKESKDKVDVGQFTTDDRSRVDKVITKGCYIALYCTTHNYLYALYPCR